MLPHVLPQLESAGGLVIMIASGVVHARQQHSQDEWVVEATHRAVLAFSAQYSATR